MERSGPKWALYIGIFLVVGMAAAVLFRTHNPLVDFSVFFRPPFDTNGPRKTYDLGNAYRRMESTCLDRSMSCIAEVLRSITVNHGPEMALEALMLAQKNGLANTTVDDHQVAHVIGRATAERFGINGPAFLRCPTLFNYGCQHGFFEYALGIAGSPQEAAALICGSIESDNSYSAKFKFYCYHGLGHGIMMAQAYDLTRALEICDSIPNGQEGCWQGAFMENVNAGMRGEARPGIFSKTDPLAPCNQVEKKYRWQCYINHSGYLLVFSPKNIENAAVACLQAEEYKIACFQGLGLLTTNPAWQQTLTGQNDFAKNIPTAISLCEKFPREGLADCFVGALDNILNYDEMELSRRALPFCQTVHGWSQETCSRQIGINIARQVTDLSARRVLCEEVETDYRKACFAGAGI